VADLAAALLAMGDKRQADELQPRVVAFTRSWWPIFLMNLFTRRLRHCPGGPGPTLPRTRSKRPRKLFAALAIQENVVAIPPSELLQEVIESVMAG